MRNVCMFIKINKLLENLLKAKINISYVDNFILDNRQFNFDFVHRIDNFMDIMIIKYNAINEHENIILYSVRPNLALQTIMFYFKLKKINFKIYYH